MKLGIYIYKKYEGHRGVVEQGLTLIVVDLIISTGKNILFMFNNSDKTKRRNLFCQKKDIERQRASLNHFETNSPSSEGPQVYVILAKLKFLRLLV